MSFALTGAACDLKCWLAFWPWANKDSGVKGMFWSLGCITSHVVVVPWRFRMDNESYPTARHLQTWDFVKEPHFSLGRHSTANVVLSEQTAEPGSLPRQYALFSKLDAQFVTEREHYGYGIPNDVNQAFTRFMGFAGAQWMGNVLIIRIDAADRPVDLSSKDEVRISALVYSGLHLRDNLNMVVGCDDGDALVKDMVRIFSVVGARTEDVLREKESLVSCWMEWKLAAGRCLTLSIACHDTFMPIILLAGTTSQMDFITSDHLVLPYPRLSMNGLSMQPVTNRWFSSRSDIVKRQRYTKLDVLNNNSSSEGPCLKGFGVMQWGDDEKTSWSDIDLCWRLGAACKNLNCEHHDNNGTWTEHFGSTR
ncbi:hypothetical protein C8J56DRAFT_904233 [Mycena floridula]|nr:hypothetical protein C8J56DRAFT_904233 [Mycena floridula]